MKPESRKGKSNPKCFWNYAFPEASENPSYGSTWQQISFIQSEHMVSGVH